MNKWIFWGLYFFMINSHAVSAVCHVEYEGGEPQAVVPKSSLDPYQFTTVELEGGFRFSTQRLTDQNTLKTYVYHYSKNRYVLIHAAEYSLNLCGNHKETLQLGLNKIYSADMERELSFQCQLIC